MTDIVIAWNPQLAIGDWLVRAGGIAVSQTGSDDLESAVYVSLFTDRAAPPDYAFPPNDTDPRGWWGDTYEDSPIGSWLWLLNRAKNTDGSILRLSKTYCQVALQWLIDEGIAESVPVRTFWYSSSALGIVIQIIKPSGQTFDFAWTWRGF